ncbi:MAG TPA: hypothetical protein VM782_08180 [Stellaceae bacterium]|nr:hypothetical protein [Stellaceae bacterium]
MSSNALSLKQNRWFRRLGIAAVVAMTLGTATMMTNSAQAHEFAYRGPAAMVQPSAYFRPFFLTFGNHHRDRGWDQHARWDHRDGGDHHWR